MHLPSSAVGGVVHSIHAIALVRVVGPSAAGAQLEDHERVAHHFVPHAQVLQNGILLFIIFHLYLIQTVMVLSAALCVDDREI